MLWEKGYFILLGGRVWFEEMAQIAGRRRKWGRDISKTLRKGYHGSGETVRKMKGKEISLIRIWKKEYCTWSVYIHYYASILLYYNTLFLGKVRYPSLILYPQSQAWIWREESGHQRDTRGRTYSTMQSPVWTFQPLIWNRFHNKWLGILLWWLLGWEIDQEKEHKRGRFNRAWHREKARKLKRTEDVPGLSPGEPVVASPTVA